MKIAQVLLCRNVDTTYDYLIPEGMSCTVGQLVKVPIGKAQSEGLIVAITEAESSLFQLREIANIADRPALPSGIVDLICWMTEAYLCSPYVAYQTVVGNRDYRVETLPKSKPKKTVQAVVPDDQVLALETPTYALTPEQEAALAILRQYQRPLHNESGKAFGGKKPEFTVRKRGFFFENETQHGALFRGLYQGHEPYLLHGVTASGKTEVYLQLAADLIAQGRQVLFLVPEIGLTPQLRERVAARFGNLGVVMHSGQTPKQRDLAWSRALSGKAAVVVGPRSAVFAPVPNLGAIILDEEHDASYKQDSHPRYWTHDVAGFRCKKEGAILVLGSATPRIETRYKVAQGDGVYLSMPYRANGNPIPSITCIDTREDEKTRVGAIFSAPLEDAIRVRLAKKEKTILLLNRRGYAPHIGCQRCQHIYACDQCGLSMTYHKDRVFRCHRCYVTAPATLVCPACHKPQLGYMGLGIQKVEIELHKLFPGVSLMRADRDSATTPKQLETVLSDFDSTGDILIGTQLVAKGHHFEGVTLVGVLGIDTALNLQDFRAPERVYQLLTQVAGRAGRGNIEGEVIVQTAQPEHYAIDSAVRNDDAGFYLQELSYREALFYPPFCRLINIVYSAQERGMVEAAADRDAAILAALTDIGVTVFPAIACPVDKVQGRYRYHILIKSPESLLGTALTEIKKLPEVPRVLRRIVDSDPVSLL